MRPTILLFLAGVTLALAAGPARAADPPSARLERVAARHSGGDGPAIRVELSPLQREITAVVDSVQAAADSLRRAGAPAAAVAAVERHGRVRVLQIQAAHAERRGRTALAARIREDLARLRTEAPRRPGRPRTP